MRTQHVSYVHCGPLPSTEAAPLQMLHTARALAELGVDVTVLAGHLARPIPAVLEHYGVAPHAKLRLRAASTRRAQLFAVAAHHAKQGALVVRGERAMRVVDTLRAAAPPFVLELHRLSFTDDPALDANDGAQRIVKALSREARRLFDRERRLVRRARGIMCLTEALAADVRTLYAPHAPIAVMGSATSTSTQMTPSSAPIPRDIDILYAGKLHTRKGVDDVIAALAHLPGVTLTLLGDDMRAKTSTSLHALAKNHGVDDRVRIVSAVAPGDMPSWWARARVGICALPTHSLIATRYTSPLKVLEMMAHGVPIVATDVPSLRSLLDDDAAMFARPSDPESLARAIRALLDDEARATRLRDNARRAVASRTWSARATEMLQFLDAL